VAKGARVGLVGLATVAVVVAAIEVARSNTTKPTDPKLRPVSSDLAAAKRLPLTLDQLPSGFQSDFAHAHRTLKPTASHGRTSLASQTPHSSEDSGG
jgi:hypothetical protein